MATRDFVHYAPGTGACDLLTIGGSNAQESVGISTVEAERIARESGGRIVLGEKLCASRIRSRPQHGETRIEIALVGEPRITVELLLESDHHIEKGVPAGSAVTLAVTSRLLGVPEIMIVSASGSGNRGDDLREALREEGISRQIYLPSGSTAYTLVLREPNGRATLVMQKPSWAGVKRTALQNLAQRNTPAAFVCTGILPDPHALAAMETLWHACPEETIRVLSPHRTSCADPSTRAEMSRLVPMADLLTVNESELAIWFGIETIPTDEAGQKDLLRRLNSRRVVITRGSKGSIAWEKDGDRFVSQPAVPIEAIGDIVGAGDVHLAACVRGLMQHLPLQAVLRLAAKVAAAKVAFQGHGVPYLGVPSDTQWHAWVKEEQSGGTAT